MRLPSLVTATVLLPLTWAAAVEPPQNAAASAGDTNASIFTLKSDLLAKLALVNQETFQKLKPSEWKKCNSKNIAVRKEWSSLTKAQRLKYINAVKCLATKQPKTPLAKAPGVRSRYDDFVATHINQTFSIHNTGNFVGWHRLFVWAYEKALREECGYDGYQPYYNWPKWAYDPMSSPALDGSATSMSGNGVYGCGNQSSYGIPTNMDPLINIPHGSGGGCIKDGPFKDWKVNLGPVFPDLTCVPPNPYSDYTDPAQAPLIGLGYNPRCLKRDISSWTTRQWTNDNQVAKLLLTPDIYTFWANLQGGVPAFVGNFMGVHTAGHFTIGGDPGGDFFTSPGDPWFFLHHAQIDRVWWTWQNLSPLARIKQIAGTITISNSPPSRNATLSDTIDMGYVDPVVRTLDQVTNTMAGPFCYRYE
ncbi:Di-copper centre-containing protein [Patellaria atrata CBS 101060]|uniref:Di-copper centre-containing protein n=1 Tax=Patellaria atrata CBS 101060 TaxID=1346257 RepID=A0A9P4SI96_9PEZI|nr:Di-copper centre-containing protein [Patellaria atrata CBS 101060]